MPITGRKVDRSGFSTAIAPDVARRQLRASLIVIGALALIFALVAGSVRGEGAVTAASPPVKLTFQAPVIEAALLQARL
ncbi:MAG TPA: hypothetical protein VIL72_15440 [Beijerinckiaceae bacterium]|jgi:hypothetical protein